MACLRLVTFFPDRPDRSFPCFISRIVRSTLRPDFLEYLRPADFLRPPDFLRPDAVFRPGDFFRAGVFRVVDFLRPVDFFRAVVFLRVVFFAAMASPNSTIGYCLCTVGGEMSNVRADTVALVGKYRSAMSMLTFYINRAGKNLPKRQLATLERAKAELRKAFGRA